MLSRGISMTDEEYNLLKNLIHREFGIELKGDKRLTLHTQLSHRLAILDLPTYKDYYDLIVSDPSREELFNLMSHCTNNETYFQREAARIDVFAGLLTELKKNKQKNNENRIRILSAGCSTGEEVYTLNIMLMESGLFAWGWDIDLIGVDVSRRALKKAMDAAYTKNSFRPLNGNEEFSKKYFDRKGDLYVLKKPYRANVEFRHGNVFDPASLADIGVVDAIFCRNVLIYMSDDAIRRIAENFYLHLMDDGYLFIGSSESLLNKTELFIPEYREGAVIYRKNPQRSSGA